MKKPIVFLIVLGVAAVASISLGVFLIFYFDSLIKQSVTENAILKVNSAAFHRWGEFNGYIDYYIFNVTNVEEVAHENFKPIVDELGPYKYRVIKKKIDVQFSEGNDTVTYKEQKHYVLDSSLGLTEEDSVNVLNMPAIIISKLVEDNLPAFLMPFVKIVMGNEQLFERRTIKEVIWGYNATIALYLNEVLQKIGFPPVNFPEFGLNVGKRKNGSISEEFNISTGFTNINQLGSINFWNGKSELPFWPGKACNGINGTDGSFWPPFVNKSSLLYVYNPEICRSIGLEYSSEHRVMGATIFKFAIPPSAFQDFKNSSGLQCFCIPNTESCLKKGVLDISNCIAGAPIVVSMPHFLNSDDEYISAIGGMSPNAMKHETFIGVEPHIGVSLEAHKRLQINLMVKNYKGFPATYHLKGILIFPVAWMDESGLLSKKDSEQLNEKLYRPMLIAQCIQYGLITFSGLCILLIIVILFKKAREKENTKTIVPVDEKTPLNSDGHPVG